MPKSNSSRNAFTLMEVMIAVMIVSIVIAALLQMRGDTTLKFFNIQSKMQTNQYSSFLLSLGDKYGFERSHIDMKRLVDDFDLESDLRRKLSAIKVNLEYEKLKSIDTNEYEDSELEDTQEESGTTGIVFEIGKTLLKTKDFSTQLIRIRIQ